MPVTRKIKGNGKLHNYSYFVLLPQSNNSMENKNLLELRNPQIILLVYPKDNFIIGAVLNQRAILTLILVQINQHVE